jgi:hypothetical protein
MFTSNGGAWSNGGVAPHKKEVNVQLPAQATGEDWTGYGVVQTVLHGIKPRLLGRAARGPVTTPTELSQFIFLTGTGNI